MKVYIGINQANAREIVEWNSAEVVNGHWVIVGGSGSGKTHRICNIAGQLAPQGVRMHILDPSGDIETDPEHTSSTEYSEISPFGINPLTVNPSPVYGGVRKRTNAFIRMINKYSRPLDEQQEATLRYLMREYYETKGYSFSDSSTWQPCDRPAPTLDDFQEFINRKLKGFVFGHMHKMSGLFENLTEGLVDLRRLQRYSGEEHRTYQRNPQDVLAQEQKLNEMKNNFIEIVTDCVERLQENEFDQYIKYNKDLLKAIYDRIENLRNFGVFKAVPAPFEPSKPIWHYDMRSLSVEEQGYLVDLTLADIFSEAIQRGFQSEVNTLIFIDEAQRFLSAADPDHITSIVYREGRKFGIGLVLATQNVATFPQDIVINSGTSLILGIDEAYQDAVAKAYGMDRVRFIEPRKMALVQIKTKQRSVGSRFLDVNIADNGAHSSMVPHREN